MALSLFTMYIAWGTTYVGIAFAIETMPDLVSMGFRFLTAAAIQFVFVGSRTGFLQYRITMKQLCNSIFLGTIMLAVGLGTVATAEHVVPLGVAALIIGSMPLWTALLRIIDHDRPRGRTLLGILAGFIGLMIILQPGHTIPRPGGAGHNITLWMLILLLGNLLWSIGSFVTSRLDTPPNSLVLTTFEMLSAGVVLLVIGLIHGQHIGDFLRASGRSWAGWSYLVIVGSVIGYSTYNWLLANAPISLVSTYSYVNPVVATILGIVIFQEKLTQNILVGGLVVLVSIALVMTSESRKNLTTPIVETT